MVIACGALGGHLREILARRGWRAELYCLPALLHNRPAKIAFEAERLALQALARGQRVARDDHDDPVRSTAEQTRPAASHASEWTAYPADVNVGLLLPIPVLLASIHCARLFARRRA